MPMFLTCTVHTGDLETCLAFSSLANVRGVDEMWLLYPSPLQINFL